MENLGGPPALLEEIRGMLGIAATQSAHLARDSANGRGSHLRSMSPIRGDVKKEFSSFLSARRQMVACIRPNLSSGEAAGSPRIPDRPGSLAVRTRRFHDAMVIRRLRFWKLRKQTRWL